MYSQPSSYNYSFVLPFEDSFNYHAYIKWHVQHWTIVNYTIIGYLILIFGGQYFMRSRQPFNLRTALFWWNFLLAIFSIWGAVRTLPELYYTLKNKGVHHAICRYPHMEGAYGFWGSLYIASKFIELGQYEFSLWPSINNNIVISGDTAFIVLRKQKLIFLHWYHHVTVLFGVCFTNVRTLSTLRWYVTANYTVHSVMYSYFAIRALGYKIPKFIMIMITSLQIFQMAIGVYTTSYAGYQNYIGKSCHVHPVNVAFVLGCYGSYFILFTNFFVRTYILPPPNQPKRKLDMNLNTVSSKKST